MKALLLALGILQLTGGVYYGIYSPLAPRVPFIIDHYEERINENKMMNLLRGSVKEEERYILEDAIELNSSYVEIIARSGRRGWNKLSEASILLLITGPILIITALRTKKAEPAGAGQPM